MSKRKVPRVRKVKGKHWGRGQASSSNPDTKKYREEAQRRFFQTDLSGRSNLTTDAVKQHDAIQQDLTLDAPTVTIGDVESASTCKTFDTFATNWTSCTNVSFQRFLTKCDPRLAIHKDRLSVLAAVTEIIKSNGGKETETEYFAALMSTLDVMDTTELTSACVALITLVIKRVPKSILKVKFPEASKTFLDMLAKFADGADPRLCKGLIGCLSVLLRAQEAAIWSNSSTMQTYQVLLSFTTHVTSSVRKAAQHAVCGILKASDIMLVDSAPPQHPAAPATAKFCIHHLEEHISTDVIITLHVLNLLKNAASTFSRPSLKASCENILRLLAARNVLISSCSFTTLHGIFRDRPKAANLPAELQAQLITALYDFQPSEKDTRLTPVWLKVVQEAHKNLHRLDEKLCFSHLARFFSVATRLWLSPLPTIWSQVTSTLKELLYHCASPDVMQAFLASAPAKGDTLVHKVVQCMEDCLSYAYRPAWVSVLQVIAALFEKLGKSCGKLVERCLRALVDLHNTPLFQYVHEVEHAVGIAIRHAGPRVVLEAMPFNLDDESLDQSWILPILRDNIRETELGFFKEYFLPLNVRIINKSKAFECEDKMALAKTFLMLHAQIWSFLPGFCTLPTDLPQSFPHLAKTLGTVLANSEDFRMDIMAALQILISKNLENRENRLLLANYAKNYIPILLNFYTNEDCKFQHRQAAYATMKVYLQIASSQLHLSLVDKAMEKLIARETTLFVRCAILGVSRALLPYVYEERIGKLHDIVLPLLRSKEHLVQKAAYHFFEYFCAADSCKGFIRRSLTSLKKTLSSSLSSTVPSSKARRLRCLYHIVEQLEGKDQNYLLSLVPEVVLCTVASGFRAESTAVHLLVRMVQKLIEFGGKENREIVQDFIHILSAGFVGSPHAIEATLISIKQICKHFKDILSVNVFESVIGNALLLLVSKVKKVVKAALDFVAFVTSKMGRVVAGRYWETILKKLGSVSLSNRSHFRITIRRIIQRLIRKFGSKAIETSVPKCYFKLLRSVRKEENKKNRLRDDTKLGRKSGRDEDDNNALDSKPQTIEELLQDSESESDEENEKREQDKERKRRGGMSAWIQESPDEIVDLLDPKSARNILATNPDRGANKTTKKKRQDFPTTTDGRLIIRDTEEKEVTGSEVEETELDNCGMKRKLEDDEEDGDEHSVNEPQYRAGGGGIHRPFKKANRAATSAPGEQYKAKKASGDMKRKGQPDPYAYLPLNFQSLNRRKKVKLANQFKGIIGAAKRGATKGRKAKSRRS